MKKKETNSKKVIIENTEFTYDIGVRILKLKYQESPVESLKDIWHQIKPYSFKEIAAIENIEERRIAFGALGIERLAKEINPELVHEETISKTTSYIDKNSQLVSHQYDDTYQLFRVNAKHFGESPRNRTATDAYYVKCKDTSTDREYFIWIDVNSVMETNKLKTITALQAIAWTIITNIKEGGIENIIRQGDCIMFKTKPDFIYIDPQEKRSTRHLTEKEYRELLILES
ncbi:MAG TPA: hypothetical protein VMR76_00030 [Candidatus Saccharimonadia bacterium]|nr:hypothetical protein [Candidatus Saccharimonadia bacterium]